MRRGDFRRKWLRLIGGEATRSPWSARNRERPHEYRSRDSTMPPPTLAPRRETRQIRVGKVLGGWRRANQCPVDDHDADR